MKTWWFKAAMKRQEGQAFILILVLLAVGALAIVPILSYAATGLRSQQVSENVMARQYASDSSLEDAMGQMLGGLLDTLSTATPTYNYNMTFEGGVSSNVSIQIPSIPASTWQQFNQIKVKAEVVPNWLKAMVEGTPVFRYTIRVDMPQWELTNIGFTLPLGLSPVTGSTKYIGPAKRQELNPDVIVDETFVSTQMLDLFDPTITTNPDGSQKVEWVLPFTASGRRVYIQTLQASGNIRYGVFYISPLFSSSGGGWNVQASPTAALGVATYNIIINVGGVTYQVVAAYDSTTGTMVIISYQVVQ